MAVIRNVPVYASLIAERGSRALPARYAELILQAVAARFVLPEVVATVEIGEPAMPLYSNPKPRFPDHLQQDGRGGEVTVEFVIDTTGRADMSTYRVIKFTEMSLRIEVTRVIPRLRFKPARLRGCPVRQLVKVPYAFNIGW